MDIILIAATTVDGYLARNNFEVTDWSQDLSLFKKQTMGFPIIMGSHTFKTLPKELHGRKPIIVHRNDNPKKIIENIRSSKCFVIGGGIVNSRFVDFLTHIYVTPHPHIFGKGVSLFSNQIGELKLKFIKIVEYDIANGIIQYQYEIIR